MAKKTEARQRAVEQKILQYKAVVEYLVAKADVASIPRSNQICVESMLVKAGWTRQDDSWRKDGQKLDLVQAGIKEFGDQYDRLKREHLRRTVTNFTEG
jgi:hypothetical protein